MSLPLEVEVSLEMRKYVVIITGDRGMLPEFKRELGHYALSEVDNEISNGMLEVCPVPGGLPREEMDKRTMMSGSDGKAGDSSTAEK